MNGHGHEFGHEFVSESVSESVSEADSDTDSGKAMTSDTDTTSDMDIYGMNVGKMNGLISNS